MPPRSISKPRAERRYGWSRPVARSRRLWLGAWSAVAIVLSGLGMTGMVKATAANEPGTLAITGGAADQHSCRVAVATAVAATNQIDFSLRAADALQRGCLEFREGSGLTVHHNPLFGHITQVVKVGVDGR